LVVDTTSSGIAIGGNTLDQTSDRLFVTDTQHRELAAYPATGTIRLNAYRLGALSNPTVTVTDADGITLAAAVQNTTMHSVDVQVPEGTARGGAYVTLVAGGTKYFGTLFIDSQDHIPAVNGCTYEASPSSTLVPSAGANLPILVITQAGCSQQLVSSESFVSAGGPSSGTAVVYAGFPANGGAMRTATIEIAGQPLIVRQSGAEDGATFTDATLSGTTVKTVHVVELRTRINTVRGQNGLSAFTWTDSVLTQGITPVRAAHVRELRAALNEAYVAAARPAPEYTDAIAAGSTPIRALYLEELRSALVALERP